jgi:hypothetical protein
MVPIDLEHADRMGTAIFTPRALARQSDPKPTFCGVTSKVPGPCVLNPSAFEKKMAAFAQEGSRYLSEGASAKTSVAHDPTAQSEGIFFDAVTEFGAPFMMKALHAGDPTSWFTSAHPKEKDQ